jgi:hypothetical protein
MKGARWGPHQGAAQNKSLTPVVGGWVKGYFFDIFYGDFERLHSPINAPKRDEKNLEKIGLDFFIWIFLQKLFDTIFAKRFL